MQRGSDKHGRRMDEALEKETRGMVQGGGENRAEEWRQAEPSGEDQPASAELLAGDRTGGVPEGLTPEDLEGRSRLAALLGKEIWPATAAELLERARSENAPEAVLSQLAGLPVGRLYDNLGQVWHDLTGHDEQHRF
jgi:hypothetical protein